MSAWAYYSENCPKAAAWLRELIKQNHIPPGEVDERSICDVQSDDLKGFRQHHFFAGIGGWPLALRLADWPDSRPVATGSCPCQPFSQAGQGRGESDERHLWPQFRFLIAQRKFPAVFGEQVESPLGKLWLAGVRSDLEALGFEVGASGLCAAGVSAPHIRKRLYWVALSRSQLARRGLHGPGSRSASDAERTSDQSGGSGNSGGMGVTDSEGRDARKPAAAPTGHGSAVGSDGSAERMAHATSEQEHAPDARGFHAEPGSSGDDCRLGSPNRQRWQGFEFRGHCTDQRIIGPSGVGQWDRFDITHCGDGKTRRIEPGTFPLAHGFPARVDLLRGYGNGIVPTLAAEFIKAAEEAWQMT